MKKFFLIFLCLFSQLTALAELTSEQKAELNTLEIEAKIAKAKKEQREALIRSKVEGREGKVEFDEKIGLEINIMTLGLLDRASKQIVKTIAELDLTNNKLAIVSDWPNEGNQISKYFEAFKTKEYLDSRLTALNEEFKELITKALICQLTNITLSSINSIDSDDENDALDTLVNIDAVVRAGIGLWAYLRQDVYYYGASIKPQSLSFAQSLKSYLSLNPKTKHLQIIVPAIMPAENYLPKKQILNTVKDFNSKDFIDLLETLNQTPNANLDETIKVQKAHEELKEFIKNYREIDLASPQNRKASLGKMLIYLKKYLAYKKLVDETPLHTNKFKDETLKKAYDDWQASSLSPDECKSININHIVPNCSIDSSADNAKETALRLQKTISLHSANLPNEESPTDIQKFYNQAKAFLEAYDQYNEAYNKLFEDAEKVDNSINLPSKALHYYRLAKKDNYILYVNCSKAGGINRVRRQIIFSNLDHSAGIIANYLLLGPQSSVLAAGSIPLQQAFIELPN